MDADEKNTFLDGHSNENHELDSRAVGRASIDDVDALAELMDESYRSTIDFEGETLQQCADEIRGVLCGKYGPRISEASFVAVVDDEIASACLVILWKGKPLIAYTMTSPRFQ